MQPIRFPSKFVWGVAAAAPQIEGAAFEGGKGPSVWDTFCRVPGAVHGGDTLDAACDHYHRFDRDFALMRELGYRNYRLSIAWPRILPEGRGRVNSKGVDFYHRLFDSMERHGITPWATMFHWDLPQALEDQGGWLARGVVDAFAQYADTLVRAFGGQVKRWFTVNEIPCFTELAYGRGIKAPGRRENQAAVNQAYHHALMCHGHGVRAVREYGNRGARVGLVDNPTVPVPLYEEEAEISAARRAFAEANARILGAIGRGRYAESYLRAAGRAAPKVARGDFALIAQPTDYLGLNIYTGHFVRPGRGGRPERVDFPKSYPRSDCSWLHLLPQSMYWAPRFAAEMCRTKAIYITEQGAGYDDPDEVQGEFADLHRRECVRNYLRELHRGLEDGLPIRGYFLWSVLDNYEWEDGYARRFGIVHTNFRTQKRTPKLSARWYAKVVASGRLI
ncbi:MAG: GH1 family beta-glucosidase [Opitutaceae bacterium]